MRNLIRRTIQAIFLIVFLWAIFTGNWSEFAKVESERLMSLATKATTAITEVCTTISRKLSDLPSNSDLEACAKREIYKRNNVSTKLFCTNEVELISAKLIDYQKDGKNMRAVVGVSLRVKGEDIPASSQAGYVCIGDPEDEFFSHVYKTNEIAQSKIELQFEKWSSGWKCSG